jgi:glycosyltransferase involved in cell wall biosynthesis
LGLTETVTFHGHLDSVSDLLGSIDVFLSNSYWEGQQTALLEAMACGCHCLAHCWGGVEEVLPAENIFVTDAELRSKLVTYSGLSATQRLEAGARMRSIAEEKFDEKRMVGQILDIVEAACAQ